MRREIILEAGARLEFDEAVLWYENQQPGLGQAFEEDVSATLGSIQDNPGRYRLVGPSIRQARLKRFSKYSILFYAESSYIGVVSLFHSSRNPDELKRRLR